MPGTNGKGHLTGASGADHALAWTYDALGRVIGKGQTGGTVTKSIGYGYSSSRLTTITLPSSQLVTYGYNSNGQITSKTNNTKTKQTTNTDQPFGPITGGTWGNGTTISRVFDTDGKLTQFNSAGLKTGKYVESDPIGLMGGNRTYSYVRSTPLLAVDPLGLSKWDGSVWT